MNAHVIKDTRHTGSTLYIREEKENLILTIVHDDKAAVIALGLENARILQNILNSLYANGSS